MTDAPMVKLLQGFMDTVALWVNKVRRSSSHYDCCGASPGRKLLLTLSRLVWQPDISSEAVRAKTADQQVLMNMA